MQNIIEKTKELGALIQESEAVKNYNQTKLAYDTDEELQKLVKEFNLHKMTLMNLTGAEEQDAERIAEVEERVKAVYTKITENENVAKMQAATKAVEELLGQVNGVLTYYITGEEPTTCTHDCSTCGGCH